jgi:glycosyltransferase A (GT-A) superfamily protein (DUF2064 family)
MSGTQDGNGAIAIFVKTPGHSAVKTRLAATRGAAFARAWHVRAAAAVAEVAASAMGALRATAYWAVAEAAALTDGSWTGLPLIGQGEGGLGARMGRVHATLVGRHGHAILLGADAPQLAAGAVRDALAWCGAPEPRQALGPADDGGFWSYAGNRAAPLAAWESVAYSRPDTAERFRAAFAPYGAWRELPRLTDVDTDGDLVAMRRELAALEAPLPAQSALADWLDCHAG